MPDGSDFDPLQNNPQNTIDYYRTKNPFDPFWVERTAGLWYRPNEQAYFKKSDNIMNRPYITDTLDPRPDIYPRIEDQRGLTLPELDLQAKFQKARHLGSWSPEAQPHFDADVALAQSQAAKDVGSENIESAARQIAAAHAGEVLSMHAPNTGRPDLPTKKVVKKKEVK